MKERTMVLSTKELGMAVRKHRKLQKLTQADLAGIAGTALRFIGELERGKPTAQVGKIFAVISALGLAITIGSKWER
jgi:y4mF family transcriptional regulator